VHHYSAHYECSLCRLQIYYLVIVLKNDTEDLEKRSNHLVKKNPGGLLNIQGFSIVLWKRRFTPTLLWLF
jgi:hypothetical protein